MKLHTPSKFQDFLDETWAWRKHELVTMRLCIQKEKKDHKACLYYRTGILLLYAHWEGFVKESGNAYINFVAYQHLRKRSELASNFIALDIRKKLYKNKKIEIPTINFFLALPEYFRSDPEIKVPRKDHLISEIAKSNLNYKRFNNIISVLGLNSDDFVAKKQKIDDLLKARNAIAHGEQQNVPKYDAEDFYEEFLKIIETYKEKVFELAESKKYLSVRT